MMPLVSSGRSGNWEAMISSTMVPSSSTVGMKLVTFMVISTLTFSFSRRKSHSRMGTVITAPASTAKQMPGRPMNQKKSLKLMWA